MYIWIEKCNELSPIENYKGILLKREDKFCMDEVNGGKLRETLLFFNEKYQEIKDKYNNSVVGSYQVNSTFLPIVSYVANSYGINFNAVVYKTQKSSNLSLAQKYNAKLYGFNVGYNNVLQSYVKKYFPLCYDIVNNFVCDITMNANINQVENIPDELDYLVVPIGSGLNFISVLKGIKKYQKKVDKIIGISVGKNSETFIEKWNDTGLQYEILPYDKPYQTKINIDDYFFDPIYEAKAYDWMKKNIDIEKHLCLLWIIGKRYLGNLNNNIVYRELPKSNIDKWL